MEREKSGECDEMMKVIYNASLPLLLGLEDKGLKIVGPRWMMAPLTILFFYFISCFDAFVELLNHNTHESEKIVENASISCRVITSFHFLPSLTLSHLDFTPFLLFLTSELWKN
eukprot:gene193-104_t